MIWVLLVVYQLKHFIADYPLQGKFMLRKFLPTPHWILPLAAHAGVHAAFTYVIALCVKPQVALWLALLDFVAHFVIDRLKASPNLGGRFQALTKKDFAEQGLKVAKLQGYLSLGEHIQTSEELHQKTPEQRVGELAKLEDEWEGRLKSNTYFWWALGADQTAHHLTHYLLIYFLIA